MATENGTVFSTADKIICGAGFAALVALVGSLWTMQQSFSSSLSEGLEQLRQAEDRKQELVLSELRANRETFSSELRANRETFLSELRANREAFMNELSANRQAFLSALRTQEQAIRDLYSRTPPQ